MSNTYVLDILERAVKTAAQAAFALISSTEVLGLFEMNWGDIASATGLAALASVLASLASSGFGRGNGTASLVPTVVDGAPNRYIP